jgi:selenocysteine lyase/cysteine desulfurase
MLTCRSEDFQLPEDQHYLNCAYMAPMPRVVEAAGQAGISAKRFPAAVAPGDFFQTGQQLRSAFARLIGSAEAERTAIIPSASYGLATAARNLPLSQGQEVVVVHEQFPSNIYTWQRSAAEARAHVLTVGADDGPNRGRRWNEALLEAIGPQTAVVAVPHVHWADGTLFDLEAIGERCRDVGAALVIDGTQSVGALPFDVNRVRPDAVVCAGYKWLLGPYSMGMAWYGPRFDDGVPLEENWISRKGSEDFAGLVRYTDAYGPGATRYDVGERSNFILAPMLLAALELLLDWGVEEIQDYCRHIASPIVREATHLGFRVEDPAWRGSHLFGMRMPQGLSADQVRQELARRGVLVSVRGDAIRVSPHVYNRASDAQALIEGLKAVQAATA